MGGPLHGNVDYVHHALVFLGDLDVVALDDDRDALASILRNSLRGANLKKNDGVRGCLELRSPAPFAH